MPVFTVIAIIIGSAVFVIFGLFTLMSLYVIINCTQPTHLTPAAANIPPLPEGHIEISDQLYGWSFRDLGLGGERQNPGEKYTYVKVFVSAEDDVVAKFGYTPTGELRLLFQTWFQNGKLLLTYFPFAKEVNEADLRVQRADSVETVYERHAQQLAIQKQAWGEAQETRTLKDVIQQHEDYNVKYHQRQMHPVLVIYWLTFVRNLILSVAGIATAFIAYGNLPGWLHIIIGLAVAFAVALAFRTSRQYRAERLEAGIAE